MRVYPGADGDFELYEDAGNGYGYESSDYRLTHLHWDDAAKRLSPCEDYDVRVVGSDFIDRA